MAKKLMVPTMEQVAVAPLNDMLTALNSLTTLLSTSNATATYSTLPGLIDTLISADDTLTANLDTLRKHQANHGRILALRAKADSLEEEIRNIIRKADTLRTEIGQINSTILDDIDDEEEPDEVDYEILLSFGARIGKHNMTAAVEAEREADRRAYESRGQTNGDSGEPVDDDDIAMQKAEMDLAVARQRAANGMAFPDDSVLRLGALGRLQLLREGERGEDAVDEEVVRLVRETEPVAEDKVAEDVDDGGGIGAEASMPKNDEPMRQAAQRKEQVVRVEGARGAAKVEKPQVKKTTLSLEYDSDEDDDDDD